MIFAVVYHKEMSDFGYFVLFDTIDFLDYV